MKNEPFSANFRLEGIFFSEREDFVCFFSNSKTNAPSSQNHEQNHSRQSRQ
jgi:hypothetical protein